MTLQGIDISFWQQSTPSLTGLSFVIARASVRAGKDTMYDTHAANVRRAGIALGAYHFWYSDTPVADQVAALIHTAADADFLVLDLEGTNANNSIGLAQGREFIKRVHALGYKIGLYHGSWAFPDLGQDFDWVAQWTDLPPTLPWLFWQYSGTGLDRDLFKGDAAALDRFLAAQRGLEMFPVVTATLLPLPRPRTWHVAAGVTLNAYDPARPGVIVKSVKFPDSSAARADATVRVDWQNLGGAVAPVPKGGPFLRVIDGVFAGLLIVASLVALDPADAPLYTRPQVDAEVQAATEPLTQRISAIKGKVANVAADISND